MSVSAPETYLCFAYKKDDPGMAYGYVQRSSGNWSFAKLTLEGQAQRNRGSYVIGQNSSNQISEQQVYKAIFAENRTLGKEIAPGEIKWMTEKTFRDLLGIQSAIPQHQITNEQALRVFSAFLNPK
jgi:hypothetical protein